MSTVTVLSAVVVLIMAILSIYCDQTFENILLFGEVSIEIHKIEYR